MSTVAIRPGSDPGTPSRQAVIVRHRWTVRDYYRLASAGILNEDSRVELINGEVVDMAPIGSVHAFALNGLSRALFRRLGEQFLIRVQDPIHLDDHSEPQPDLVVAQDRNYSAGHPQAPDILLVVEVADTTLAYDRDIKVPLYARSGIPQVWLLDVNTKRLTVYLEPTAEGYRQVSTPGAEDSLEVGGVVVPVGELVE